MKRAPIRQLAVLGALLALPSTVFAAPLFELFGDPSGGAGFTGRYGKATINSIYFNPALMTKVEPGFEAGIYVFTDQIGITTEARPEGGNSTVGLDAAGAFTREGNSLEPAFPPPVPTSWLEYGCEVHCESRLVENPAQARPRQAAGTSQNTRSYLVAGMVTRLIDQYLVFGFTLLTPLTNFLKMRSFYPDEREQYFSNSLHPELYSDRLEMSDLAVGVASQIWKRLSIGVSVTLDINGFASAPTFVPDASAYDQLLVANEVDVSAVATPHFGVVYDATDALQITGTFHTVQSLEWDGEVSTLLPDGSEQSTDLHFVYSYLPWQLALGASYRFDLSSWQRLTLSGGLNFQRWSLYQNRQGEEPSGDYAWSDTLVPSLGVSYDHGATNMQLSTIYAASPVPEQTGRTNYVDSDRLGITSSLHKIFPVGREMKIKLGVSAQLHRLFPRSHDKLMPEAGESDPALVQDEVPDNAVTKLDPDQPVADREGLQTNNPGFPGYSHEGWIYGGGLSAELIF
jgi:long-chain fatty acid transport protein